MRRFALRTTLVLYAALLIAPLGALLPGNEWALSVAASAVGAVVGTVATDARDPETFVHTAPRGLAGVLLPLAWLVPAVTRAESVVSVFVSPWFLGSIAALAWFVALLLGHEVRQHRLQERLTTVVSFEAGPPENVRRQTKYAVGVFLAATTAIVVAVVLIGGDAEPTSFVWLPAMLAVWLSLFTDQKQSVEITDEGIFAQRTLHDWETIDGYERGDDALEITRTDWYRATMRFDPHHIDDIDAVTDALDRYV
ncbi:DUF5673 domain-containing protein [Halapricum desulfuricans]|nr:DUF5673 domain-containing protein [Halapricum desulfuricans]